VVSKGIGSYNVEDNMFCIRGNRTWYTHCTFARFSTNPQIVSASSAHGWGMVQIVAQCMDHLNFQPQKTARSKS